MKSPMLRFFFVILLVLLFGLISCKDHAEDVCLNLNPGDPCQIDGGCGEPADPGICQPMGDDGILTCIAL